jgi:hypothetical protein
VLTGIRANTLFCESIMNRENFENLVSKAKQSNPTWFEMSDENHIIDFDKMSELESEYSVTFPESLKHFLSVYGSGYFAFTSILSPFPDNENSLWDQIKVYSLPSDFIPISENGCGDYYGFKVTDGVCSEEVYFLDHESEYKVGSIEYSSFYEFVVSTGLKN